MTLEMLAAGLVGASFSWLLVGLLLPRLRRSWLDPLTPRSSHRQPTPRGGGLAFVMVGSALLVVVAVGPLRWIGLAALPLALVGLLDDRYRLPAGLRLVVQLATAVLLVALLVHGPLFVGALPPSLAWCVLGLLVLAITAVINFANFMDGLDGLLAGCALVQLTVSAWSFQEPALAGLAAAVLGFLIWNWSPAQVFMGDVGSTFLGAQIAAVVLLSRSWPQALGLLLVGFPLLADAGICVLRRAFACQPLMLAHRQHLYQRLQQAGWSHRQVASLYTGATAACGLAFLAKELPGVSGVVGLLMLVGWWLDHRVACPFAVDPVGSRQS